MYHYEKRSEHPGVTEKGQGWPETYHGRHLFQFGDSYTSAFVWLAVALLSFVAMLASDAVWLPLVASLLFAYWAWSAFWRARRQLRVYRNGMLLSTAVLDPSAPQWIREHYIEIPFGDTTHIDLRGSGLRVERRGNMAPVMLIEGLSSRKKHQFLHLFDLQQRRGAVPRSISFSEPRISSAMEITKILFAGVMVLWVLQALTL